MLPSIPLRIMAKQFKGYLHYKTVLCHKAALDV